MKEQTMKNHITLKNRIPAGGITCATAALALLLIVRWPAAAENGNLNNPEGVVPPVVQTQPYGMTYDEWSAKYWQWTMAFPSNADPARTPHRPNQPNPAKCGSWPAPTAAPPSPAAPR